MSKIIFGPRPQRYETQWQGNLSRGWFHGRYFKHRLTAVAYAFLARVGGPTRVIDHGKESE